MGVLNLPFQGLKEEIDSRLSRVQEICFEPRLLSEEDDRLKQGSQISQSLNQLTSLICPFICVLLWLVGNLLKRVSVSKVATTTCTE